MSVERGLGGFGREEAAEYVRGETVRECHQGRGGDLGIGRHLARSQLAVRNSCSWPIPVREPFPIL